MAIGVHTTFPYRLRDRSLQPQLPFAHFRDNRMGGCNLGTEQNIAAFYDLVLSACTRKEKLYVQKQVAKRGMIDALDWLELL